VRLYMLSLGVPFEQKDCAFGGDEWKAVKSELIASGNNPSGALPILEDGDIILSESNTIMRYVANKYNKQIGDCHTAAINDMLLDKVIPLRDSSIGAALSSSDEQKAQHKASRAQHYDILEILLKKHIHTNNGLLGGDRLLPADISVFAVVQDDARLFGPIEGKYPALEKLLNSVAKHPVVEAWGKAKDYLPYACCPPAPSVPISTCHGHCCQH